MLSVQRMDAIMHCRNRMQLGPGPHPAIQMYNKFEHGCIPMVPSSAFSWEDVLPFLDVHDRRQVSTMCCGISVYRQGMSLLLLPDRDVRVLPAGHHESSFVQSPQAIVNTTSIGSRVEGCLMGRGLDVNDAYMRSMMARLGLDPERTVMFGTAANMENAARADAVSRSGVRVSVAVTGGIRGNGGRAGDPASFDEAVRYIEMHGTIVILLAIEAHLTDGAMVQAVSVATQAKSSVIQELMARSLYSQGIATGSGTDQVAVITDTGSGTLVSDCSIGSDIGGAVARCVREALYRTFDLQSGMDPEAQCDPFVMLSRFGRSEFSVLDEIRFPCTMDAIQAAVRSIHGDKEVAAAVSAVLCIADGVRLGSIAADAGLAAARRMMEGSVMDKGDIDPLIERLLSFETTVPGYVSMVLAVLVRKRAMAIQGAEA